jgi:hypothetical protein
MIAESPLSALIARWRRMDAAAAAAVLEATTWSYLTGDHVAARMPAAPPAEWLADGVPPTEMTVADRAASIAHDLLAHDPRFAGQLARLSDEPFSDDFQEFIYLLIREAAAAGATYARHLDGDRGLSLARLSRATAALLGIEQLPDSAGGQGAAA